MADVLLDFYLLLVLVLLKTLLLDRLLLFELLFERLTDNPARLPVLGTVRVRD